MRSGFVTLVGRPNVGKSTLLNTICGAKVSIMSDKPQTTRTQVRGVLHTTGVDGGPVQVVFVDTPGIHKPRTPLGERLNATAADAVSDVDVTCLVIDATGPFGRGDRFIADRVSKDSIVVVNKIDAVDGPALLRQLEAAGERAFSAYFPVSATTGEGVGALVDELVRRMPDGPPFYPEGQVTDVPEAFWVAELVREQLLDVLRDEVPHSIATRVTEWEWPRVRCEILVERDSQKGIVIGHRGEVLKEVGTRVRQQMDPGAFLELHVKVDRNWQRRPERFERYGY